MNTAPTECRGMALRAVGLVASWGRLMLLGLFALAALISVPAAQAAPRDTLYVVENGGIFHIAPDVQAPAIFPLDLGREFIELERNDDWIKAKDSLTGLIGWAIAPFLGPALPDGIETQATQDRKAEFDAFKARFDGLNRAIADATGYASFERVEHMGGGAVRIFAEDGWYDSRRSEQQAYRIFGMWKIANAGQPVFVSFADSQGKERFIVLDGPNRPRLLTARAE